MTPEQWQKIEVVLQQALDLPQHERDAFLTNACDGDEKLRREVDSLTSAHEESGDFIERPALESDAEVLFSFGDNNIGRAIGPYRIIERLGVGGMGEVYLARDQRLDRSVALKILPDYFSDEIRLSRFRKEARAASALNHPNIITIHEVGQHDDVRFIATEFIEGVTLRELLSNGPLGSIESLEIVEQVCIALSAAHAAGIVHRDIKPENIMRRPDGIVKLLDFGIAKLNEPAIDGTNNQTQTEIGVVMGTVSYMSPEQARGLTVDERSDIWSLGVVLYEMLTGRLPFTRENRLDTLVAILERDPEPVFESDNPLQKLIGECLAKDASQRFQSASQLLERIKILKPELRDVAPRNVDQAGNISEEPTVLLTRKSAKSRIRLLLIASLAVLIAVAGIAYWRFAVKSKQSGVARSNNGSQPPKLYSQMSDAERLVFIDEQEQRISTMMGERPAKLNADALKAIKQVVDRYVRRDFPDSKMTTLSSLFERAVPYQKTIGRSFKERNVPVVIGIYLPMIESAYVPCYENVNGSKGLYQFLPGTAAQYGVTRDQMCDAEKMTPAAAHYIADRMAELGDDSQSLTLVILSYTTGPEWVRDSLRRLRESGYYERNFWTMFEKRDLLDETFRTQVVGYVPSFFAAAIIGENPSVFGLSTPPLTTLAQ